jgi:UDP-N-acetylglucosamine--N-acetylmuramyl-(pentapeptide) pyrophosphoryl-undecaprenol N-acetylglucosamine transferase
MKFIISGGGTGGHIFPAVAIANEIRRREPTADILFVGANGRMEMTRVPEAGYEIVGLDITGLQRRLTPQNLLFPMRVFRSVRKAGKLVESFRPDAVVGVGGYASAPVLLAATSRGIPSLIQEQNSYAGLVNKLLGRRVNKICVAYEGMESFFPADKMVLTGNPVRTEIARGNRAEAQQFFGLDATKKTLLIIGGSLGASGRAPLIWLLLRPCRACAKPAFNCSGKQENSTTPRPSAKLPTMPPISYKLWSLFSAWTWLMQPLM